MTTCHGEGAGLAVSVVIPTFRRPHQLDRCLSGIGRNLEPGDEIDVIVVDDGGGRDEAALRAVLARQDFDARLVVQDHEGPAIGRNRGCRMATGDLIAFLDDDAVPSGSWLRDLRGAFASRPELAGLGGRVTALYPNRWLPTVIDEWGPWRHRYDPAAGWYLVTANAAFRTEAIEAIGGFDERYRNAAGEDVDLSWRMNEAGFVLDTTEQAVVYHEHPERVRDLLYTMSRYAKAQVLLESRHEHLKPKPRRGGLFWWTLLALGTTAERFGQVRRARGFKVAASGAVVSLLSSLAYGVTLLRARRRAIRAAEIS